MVDIIQKKIYLQIHLYLYVQVWLSLNTNKYYHLKNR